MTRALQPGDTVRIIKLDPEDEVNGISFGAVFTIGSINSGYAKRGSSFYAVEDGSFFWLDQVELVSEGKKDTGCSCTSRDLFHYGCRCSNLPEQPSFWD